MSKQNSGGAVLVVYTKLNPSEELALIEAEPVQFRLGDMGLGQDWFIGISSGGGGAWWSNGGCLYFWGCLWVIGGTHIVTQAGWFQLWVLEIG
uniref:Uncharacterized protein n=1 Tax=Fagus sylvatica TaxID=28930 RepID=A0A2N9HFM7_FAGSY